MALMDTVRAMVGNSGDEPSLTVNERIRRAEVRMKELRPIRNECWQFFRGNSYVYRTDDNTLVQQGSTAILRGRTKERHRVRTERPILVPLIRQEVSRVTANVPSYEVSPTNTDPQTRSAANVSRKVLLYGYEKWKMRQVIEDLATHALVADEGFAWPYWDKGYGAKVGTADDGTSLYKGEICIRVYGSNQVGWEPGVKFEDSRYWIVQCAEPVDEVLATPGCLVSTIAADASGSQIAGTGKPSTGTSKLALITRYLERPSASKPKGQQLTLAGGKIIFPREDYPFVGKSGPIDRPVLHKLSVIRDPDSDHDLGLVRFGLDAIRTYNDANNKALEFKNIALNPQAVTFPGNLDTPPTDEPGIIIEAKRPDQLNWRPPPDPAYLNALFEIADRAKADLGFIFSQNSIPNQVEAAAAIEAYLQNDQNARAAFTRQVADVYASIAHHCLSLVQQYYTEPRDLQIVGTMQPEMLYGFLGADLLDQTSVRVLPGSLEPLTQEALTTKVMSYAQLGWISPQAAMAAIDGGTAEVLVKDYEFDIGRAEYIIQLIKQGPQALFGMAPFDMGQPPTPDNPQGSPPLPGWMPRPFDKVPVHKQVFENWFKSADWDMLPMPMREAALLYYNALVKMEQDAAAAEAQQQIAMAQGLGQANAAKPQPGVSPVPQAAMQGPPQQ